MPDKDTIFFIFPNDISSVQGSTEAYYIAKHFAQNTNLHLFSTSNAKSFDAETYQIPGNSLLSLAFLNILYLPYFLYLGIRYRPDVVYFYRNVILPPLLIKYTVGSTLVCDLQCDPYEQPKEFLEIAGGTLLTELFLQLSFCGHNFVMGKSDLIVTLSERLKSQLVEQYSINPTDVVVSPLGVDVNEFVPIPTEGTPLKLVYVGTIVPRRNIEAVVSALRELRPAAQEKVRLEMFGSGDQKWIDQLLADLDDTACKYDYHGYIPHEDVPEAVGNCDVALSPLPPHNSYEVSSPAKIFEYLALGLPIIATDIGPHRDILSDGEDALFVTPDDPEEISRAILTLLEEKETRKRLAENARKNALQHSWESRFGKIRTAVKRAKRTEQ